MPSVAALLEDPWLRGCAAAGALMLAVDTIVGLPWPLWLAWAWLTAVSALDVRGRDRRPTRDTGHDRPAERLWQTRPDE